MKSRFLKSLKILLVEDEAKLAELLKKAIADNFHTFTLASDGEEGLKKYVELVPDIVITDIMMPKMTGLDMSKEIKNINPNTPIIILSAYSETDKLLNAIDVGVVKYFIKPFEPDEVLEYISSLRGIFEEQILELCDGFTYSYSKNSLYKNSRYIFLSKNEKVFLKLMLEDKRDNMFSIVSSRLIKNRIWGEDVSDERLRTFIKRFRDKTSKNLLKNVKRQGYIISTQC